ncbi:MAG: hypothetical protein HRU10_12175 [Opitutales bacterium]|nr:hypothetical protein [Opitutales bacterium]
MRYSSGARCDWHQDGKQIITYYFEWEAGIEIRFNAHRFSLNLSEHKPLRRHVFFAVWNDTGFPVMDILTWQERLNAAWMSNRIQRQRLLYFIVTGDTEYHEAEQTILELTEQLYAKN